MTRETAQKLLPVITAWSEGKDIQARTPGTGASGWETPTMPSFREDLEWRIKPREPREWKVKGMDGGDYLFLEGGEIEPGEIIHFREILPDETP